YFVSAAVGVALTILFTLFVSWVLARQRTASAPDSQIESNSVIASNRRHRKGFIEKTFATLSRATQEARLAEGVRRSGGLLQSLDARVNLSGIGVLIAGS